MRDLRIALCVSGQMRTFEECFPSLDEYILKRFKPDVFIHTWDLVGRSVKEREGAGGHQMLSPKQLECLYHPIEMVVEPFDDGICEEYQGVRVPEILKEKAPRAYRGTIPLFYKIWSCNQIKTQHELACGSKYDVVIRCRPDIKIRSPLPILENLKLIREGCLFFEQDLVNPEYRVSDKLLFSNSGVMNMFSNLWECLNEYWENPLGESSEKRQWRIGEKLVFQYTRDQNIPCRGFNVGTQILRFEKNAWRFSKWWRGLKRDLYYYVKNRVGSSC